MPEYRFRDTSLDFDERTAALLEELTVDEKLGLLTSHMNEVPRLGIKEFWIGTEVARGLVCRDPKGEYPTTVFPEPFGLAATFDASVMERMGEVAGVETRIYSQKGKSSLCVWGPTVDLERDPRWGRTEEAYGEDPCLAGTMAAAYTRGMAGTDEKYMRVIPTLKHFYANNNEDTRVNCNASVPTRLKHEYYLKAFEKPVRDGRALSLMTSYNEVNGIEQLCSPELQFAREQWGLLFAVTDGGDFTQNVQYHRSDNDHTSALVKVLRHNGADIMTDNEDIVRAAAQEALDSGLITVADIDRALTGPLKARFMLGEFDDTRQFDYPESMLCTEESARIAQEAAEKSVILLKNSRGVLPLNKDGKLAVIGYHADMLFRDWYTGTSPKCSTILDVLTAQLGRESIVYDCGNDIIALRNAANGFYFTVSDDGSVRCDSPLINESCLFELFEWGDGAVSLRSRLNNKFLTDCGVMKCTAEQVFGWFVHEMFYLEKNGRECRLKNWQKRFLTITPECELTTTESLRPPKNSLMTMEVFSDGTERARRVATEAHNVVVFCGNNPMINARETTDRKHLKLPEKQSRNLDAVLELNPNAVLYLVSGYPYQLDNERVATLMHICHAGPALGSAVFRTLFGEVSPAGRCPVTWYRSGAELCNIEDYNIVLTRSTYLYYDGEPLFPFGYGMSYTGFRYCTAKPDKPSYTKGDTVKVTLDIENVGMMDSDEVVQLYVAPNGIPMTVPKKQLRAFRRVFVPRGETVTVELTFPVDELSYWNVNKNDFDLISGSYTLMIGASSADIRRTCEIQVNASDYQGVEVSGDIAAVSALNYVDVKFEADAELREYALINDWQSSISFEYCRLRSYHMVSVTASNPGPEAKLSIIAAETGRTVAEVVIPPTGSLARFTTVNASAEPLDGLFTLRLTSSGMLSLLSFRFS